MAIAFDNSTTVSSDIDVPSLSVNHTASGTDRLLLVTVSYINSGFRGIAVDVAGATPTYLIGGGSVYNDGVEDNVTQSHTYFLSNPASGPSTVTATFSGGGVLLSASLTVNSYTGVDQVDPIGASASFNKIAPLGRAELDVDNLSSLLYCTAYSGSPDGLPLLFLSGETVRSTVTTGSGWNRLDLDHGIITGDRSPQSTGTQQSVVKPSYISPLISTIVQINPS